MCTASRSGASTGTGASSLDGVMITQRAFRETSRGALEPCPHASGCVYAGVASSLQVGATRHWNGSDFTTWRRDYPGDPVLGVFIPGSVGYYWPFVASQLKKQLSSPTDGARRETFRAKPSGQSCLHVVKTLPFQWRVTPT